MKKFFMILAVLFAGFMIFFAVSCSNSPTSPYHNDTTVNQTPTPATGDDSYEVDNDFAEAKIITTDGYPQYHNFYTADAYDYVSFTAESGNRYYINVAVSYPAEFDMFEATIFNDSYAELMGDAHDYSETNSNYMEMFFECTFSSVYYIRIYSGFYSGAYSGYLLSVKKTDAHDSVAFDAALDNTSFSYTQGGNEDWTGQMCVNHDSVDAGQSGDINEMESSYFETAVNAGAHVSFYWKVSSEKGWDFLTFYADGVQIYEISGKTEWANITYDVSSAPGTHTLRWEYSKDTSTTEGFDAGFVDQLVVTYP